MKLAHPILTRTEEQDLARRYRAGDRAAGNRLVECNRRYVMKVVGRWTGYGLDIEDLLQEGCIGLMRALDHFDPDRGLRFISYATHWVDSSIRQAVMNNHSLVKVGTTQKQRRMFFRLGPTFGRLEQEGVQPGELAGAAAAELDVSPEDIEEMGMRMTRPTSVDAHVPGTDDLTFVDLIQEPSDAIGDLEHRNELSAQLRRIMDALTILTERERYVVTNRLMAEKPMTHQEIGKHFGFSREYARQVELSVIRKLRARLMTREVA